MFQKYWMRIPGSSQSRIRGFGLKTGRVLGNLPAGRSSRDETGDEGMRREGCGDGRAGVVTTIRNGHIEF